MINQISPAQMAVYKATARRRLQAEEQERAKREETAWKLARQAAELLRDNYQATEVRVYGSLVHNGRFHFHSDIDLAAWGLTDQNWLKASAAVRSLSNEIEINLADIAVCPLAVREAIDREGIPI
jgi:uncharacterized protein